MANRFLLAVSPAGHSFVLGLEPRTKADCQQTIAWMHVGGFNMDYRICTYDREIDRFVDEAGELHEPSIGPYTRVAWKFFRILLDSM